jgi:parallel beta-helix repeat protein
MTLIGGTIRPQSGACAVLVTGHGVTLNGVQVNGAGMADQYAIGIRTFKANNVTITGCNVYDCKYAGIMVLSAQTGSVTGNTISRIGVGGTVGVSNASGIAVSSQNPATDAQATDVMVSGNTVEDVPTWHALDTHAGVRITFRQNTVRNSRSPVFVTGDGAGRRSTDCDVDDNHVYAGGTPYWALTSVYSTGGYLRNNTISGWPSGQEILTTSGGDPNATAVNLTISGNTVTP